VHRAKSLVAEMLAKGLARGQEATAWMEAGRPRLRELTPASPVRSVYRLVARSGFA